MNSLPAIRQHIKLLDEKIECIQKDLDYHYECIKQKKEESTKLDKEREEWINKKELLEMKEMTEEEKTTVRDKLQFLADLINNKSVIEVDLMIRSLDSKGQVLKCILYTEMKEKGMSHRIVVQTNRKVVRDMLRESIQIPYHYYSEENDFYEFYWSKEETPDLSMFKENNTQK
jgi:hypothetical protein